MKIPKQLKIGGHTVEIVVTSDIPTMSWNMGECWSAFNKIKISSMYPKSQQEVTLFHEIIHHCLNQMGRTFKHESPTEPHTEQTVEGLAQALYQVLKDNDMLKED